MAVEQFRDGRHPTNSMRMPGFPLVGLRSKTSLESMTRRLDTVHAQVNDGSQPIFSRPKLRLSRCELVFGTWHDGSGISSKALLRAGAAGS
jgi:hypothetical protein